MLRWRFPKDFLWGCAAASYQIEGAPQEDGKGPSIWDSFCKLPGRIHNGDSGNMACDHYHRWQDDLDLISRLGIPAYRFSVSWPRIYPQGRGTINEKGVDFYDRLIDGMLARGIKPALTCYHWDLPQALEDKGGWRVRSTADAFAEYCNLLAQRFGDRVDMWFTLNELSVVWILGYKNGTHAPGAMEPEKVHRQVCHNLLLAHGLGVRAIRKGAPRPVRVGLVSANDTCVPYYESEEHIDAARSHYAKSNDWVLAPIFHGHYPEVEWNRLGADVPDVASGDLEIINQPGDFLGINGYAATKVIHAEHGVGEVEHWFPRTDFSWPIMPDFIYWTLRYTHEIYAKDLDLYITENGCCFPDEVNRKGRVEDYARMEYLRHHLRGVHRAVDDGLPVRGYFVWSIMDNFEWASGYSKRFGLIHVNYETLHRTPKESAHWYGTVIRNSGF